MPKSFVFLDIAVTKALYEYIKKCEKQKIILNYLIDIILKILDPEINRILIKFYKNNIDSKKLINDIYDDFYPRRLSFKRFEKYYSLNSILIEFNELLL